MQNLQKKTIKQQVVYIPTTDLDRARRFYASVFDFEVEAFSYVQDPSGEEWSLFPLTKISPEGKTIPTGFFFLGLAKSPHFIPSDKGTIPFLPSDDIDATLELVTQHGGTVILSKTIERPNNPNLELFHAFFLDPEGNKIGLTQAAYTEETPPAEPQTNPQ